MKPIDIFDFINCGHAHWFECGRTSSGPEHDLQVHYDEPPDCGNDDHMSFWFGVTEMGFFNREGTVCNEDLPSE